MSGYPLGSPELRQHVHNMVELALWRPPPIHEGIFRKTGCVIPKSITDLASDDTWRRWGML